MQSPWRLPLLFVLVSSNNRIRNSCARHLKTMLLFDDDDHDMSGAAYRLAIRTKKSLAKFELPSDIKHL